MKILIKQGVLEADLQPDIMQEVQEDLMMLARATGVRISRVERGLGQVAQEVDKIADTEERIFAEIDSILDEISRLKRLLKSDISKTKQALSKDLKRQLIGVAMKTEVDRLERRIKKVNKPKKVIIKPSREFYNDVVELDDMSNNQTRNLVNQVRQSLPKPVKTRREKGVKDGRPFMGELKDTSKLPI